MNRTLDRLLNRASGAAERALRSFAQGVLISAGITASSLTVDEVDGLFDPAVWTAGLGMAIASILTTIAFPPDR